MFHCYRTFIVKVATVYHIFFYLAYYYSSRDAAINDDTETFTTTIQGPIGHLCLVV